MSKQKPRQGEIWTVNYSSKYPVDDHSYETESQIKKLRPSVILTNNIWNFFEETVLVVPLTGQVKFTRVPFEIRVSTSKQNGLQTDSKLLLGQIRPVSIKNRLEKLVGVLETSIFEEIQRGINFLISAKNL